MANILSYSHYITLPMSNIRFITWPSVLLLALVSCDTGNLDVLADLPLTLKEVSGTETLFGSELIWMLNDGGNAPKIYGLNKQGDIIKELVINAKNNDWEDLASDKHGNLYIGDFGNNLSKRKNLAILKVKARDLSSDSLVEVERISFRYPNQSKFPPKKKQRHFDSEAFVHYNDSLYIFTKSRVRNDFGKTNLYKIPAKRGNHLAELIGTFNSCPDIECWITSADISIDEKKVVLLTSRSVWLFTDFKTDNFLDGASTEYLFEHSSQKEGICFKDSTTMYITDEKAHGAGGNLYEFSLN